jgi:hypothetical protein
LSLVIYSSPSETTRSAFKHFSTSLSLADSNLAFFRLQKLLGNVVISQGGVVPHIAPELLPTKSGKGRKEDGVSQEI